jgi:hypothetical protein
MAFTHKAAAFLLLFGVILGLIELFSGKQLQSFYSIPFHLDLDCKYLTSLKFVLYTFSRTFVRILLCFFSSHKCIRCVHCAGKIVSCRKRTKSSRVNAVT